MKFLAREIGEGREAGLSRSGGQWVVTWRTPVMSGSAFVYYPRLLEAWRAFVGHRAGVHRAQAGQVTR